MSITAKQEQAELHTFAVVGCETPQDIQDLSNTVQQALQFLGKEDFSLIIHGGSFPSSTSLDTGFGSPYSQEAKSFFRYVKSFGINSIQLGPGGKTKFIDASPYVSTTFSGNPLFIDLIQLVEEGLLKESTLTCIHQNNPELEQPEVKHRTAYEYIYKKQAEAFQEAFALFQKKNDSKLLQEFQTFCQNNQNWLDNDALYEALSVIHQNDYWPNWPNELDKRLLSPQSEEESKQAKQRIEEIQKSQTHVIELYQFEQWLLDRQKKAFLQWAKDENILLIADRQVGFSERDVWAYQTLFLEDWCLGAPQDYFSKDGQAWNMPVLNPDLLFNQDGSLGPAGQFLKKIFDKTFAENPGGVRIDHIIGLIDPWVYPKGKHPKPEEGAGRLFSSPEHQVLNRYSIIHTDQINHDKPSYHEERVHQVNSDNIQRYGRLLQLVLDSASAHNVPHSAIICEDLGTLTEPVKAVLKAFGLSGIRVTQFVEPEKFEHIYRGKNCADKHWIMAGSHDNEPLYRWSKTLFSEHRHHSHVRQLQEDLQQQGRLSASFALPFAAMEHDYKALLLAKYAELFASPSKHVQVFFSDFFGIDGVYNRPGMGGKKNWTLRLPNDYNTFYANQLKRQVALNLPLALHLALASHLPEHPDSDQVKLLDKLAYWGHRLQQVHH